MGFQDSGCFLFNQKNKSNPDSWIFPSELDIFFDTFFCEVHQIVNSVFRFQVVFLIPDPASDRLPDQACDEALNQFNGHTMATIWIHQQIDLKDHVWMIEHEIVIWDL